METVTLSNGKQMPAVGFGTWKAPSDEITVNAVKTAVECGYTHIDAAAAYHNEISGGQRNQGERDQTGRLIFDKQTLER